MRRTKAWFATAVTAGVTAVLLLGPPAARAERSGTFTGSWTANGTWQSLAFLPGREVFLLRMSGHGNLKSDLGNESDYWVELVGLWDSVTGGTARCAWQETGGRGAAFATLEGRLLEEDQVLTGTFVGGTGALEGLSGSFSLTWSEVIRNGPEQVVTAHADDLAGEFSLP